MSVRYWDDHVPEVFPSLTPQMIELGICKEAIDVMMVARLLM